MKSIKLIFAFLFYFITSFSYSQGEFLIEIDTATGSYNQIGVAIAGVTWVYPYERGYDEKHGVYIFKGGASLVDRLYAINVTDGSIIYNPYIPNFVREPQYDSLKDSLYGLYWDNSLAQFFLTSINSVTGIYTQVGVNPIAGLTSTSQGLTAYDVINHRYFTLQNNQLFSIDASNGNLISKPVLNAGSGEQLLHFCYNNSSNILYGLLQNSNTQICYLVSINTTTGVMTKIGNSTLFGLGGGSSSIDKINQRYIYTYTTGGSTFYITTVDIATGNIIANKLIPLSSGDNIHSIAYDNIKDKLYGIQWDADALPPPPCQITVNSASICFGNSCTLIASGATTYLWSNGATTNSITVSPSSPTTYTVTGIDVNNCSSITTTNVNVNFLPKVTANSNITTLCAGSWVMLTGSGANSYSWTSGVTDGISFTPSSTKTYTVTGIDGNNCSNTDTTTITVIPNAVTTVGMTASATTVCSGTAVTLTGTGASSYLWSNGSTDSVITVLNSGTYWVWDNSIQCSNKDSITITVNQIPAIDLGNDITICEGQTVTVTGGSAEFYLWSNGSTTFSIAIDSSGIYWLQANNEQCFDRDSLSVSILDCEIKVEVPNIFTPNNDGLNDIFTITTKNVATLNCKIYNRWGILVSELTKTNEVWNGLTTSGLQCTEGVYFWIVEYKDSNGTNNMMKGFIQLLR